MEEKDMDAMTRDARKALSALDACQYLKIRGLLMSHADWLRELDEWDPDAPDARRRAYARRMRVLRRGK